jgi:serine/threonine protein kinase
MANDYGPSNSYSAAIDMWACGCILAELLSMQKESHEQPDERAALFPGKTCFPLSAENVSGYSDRLDQLNGSYTSLRLDVIPMVSSSYDDLTTTTIIMLCGLLLLIVIFDVIGTPTSEEIANVPSSKARNHLTQLPAKPKIPLGTKYAFADKRGIHIYGLI